MNLLTDLFVMGNLWLNVVFILALNPATYLTNAKHDCGDIVAPVNGHVFYYTDITTNQETATFTCYNGYSLSHNETRVCDLQSGNWNGTTAECIILDCHSLTPPLHGSVTYSNGRTTFQEVATFTCDRGYFLSHNGTRACDDSGNWNGTTPECILQDCSFLTPPHHGSVTYSNGRTNYQEVATFTCDRGYYLSHDGTRRCNATGQWEGTTPKCIKRDCDVLPALLHGTVSYSNGRTTYKEVATFTCDVGYYLSHIHTRTCDDFGKWTGTTPVCIIQDCNTLTAPLHGTVTYTNRRTTYGEVATFTCEVGFYLSHNETRTCGASGNWGGTTPECIIHDCDIIPDPLHGAVSYSNDRTIYQEVAKFTCDHGYHLSHGGAMTCAANGQWEGVIPTCLIIDCSTIRPPIHGAVSYSHNRTTYREVATFSCDLGYYKSHDTNRTCDAFGRWTGNTPRCLLIDCGFIRAPAHGTIKYSNGRTTYKEVATFTCNSGYVLSHGEPRICGPSGNWMGTTPDCNIIDCGEIPDPKHGSVSYSNNRTTYQEYAYFTCDTGYHLLQYIRKTCGASGNWSGTTEPHCLITDCGDIPAPPHGKVSYSSGRTTYLEVATFTCDYGYYLSHDWHRTCDANGYWRGISPQCIVRECDDVPAPQHGSVTYSNNRRTYQEVATFTCGTGYYLSHDEQMLCEGDGHWSGSVPECIIKDCGDIRAPNHGYVSFSNNRSTYQELATFTCEPGYYLSHDLPMICKASGNWDGTVPECFIKDCGIIPAPLHGNVSFTNNRTTYREVATFTCDLGYYLSNIGRRTCEDSGKWSGSTPECFIKDCGSNHTIPNGYFEFLGENTTYNSTFEVICNPGYEVHGDPAITCLHHGSWSNRTACHIKDCGKSVNIHHGQVNLEGRATTFNESISVTCNMGYEIQGDNHITCLAEGVWSNTSECVIKDCGNMYALDNGIVNFSGFKTTFNHSVPINCDTGYEIHGDDQITCLPEGTWSSNSACHIKDCGLNVSIESGYVSFEDRNTTFNQTVPVFCDAGFEIAGDRFIICLHDGLWSNSSSCVSKDSAFKYLIPIMSGALPFVAMVIVIAGAVGIYLKRRRSRSILDQEEGPSFEQFDMDYKNWREFRKGPVNLVDFPAYVDKMHENSNLLFADGFRLLEEESPIHPRTVAEMEPSRQKSRYTDILPFDHSRVKLIPFDDDEGSDYINASYIPGYTLRREYIVTQGPMPSTKDDFWQMVWEQKVDIIVMLTKCVERGRTKCEKYWPDQVQEPVFAGELVINMRSESALADHFIRIIEVTYGTKTQIVTHFQYLKWPDHGCPRGYWPLLNFITMVRQFRRPNSAGLMLIHCSAGVGRTGTYIAVDRLLQHIRDHDDVDVYSVLLDMRNYRCNMVQTEDQFIYVYECLRHFITKESDNGDAVSASPYPSAAYTESAFDNSAFQRE